MKIAPLMREMARHPDEFEQTLVHTGQHYDESMSKTFFDELDLPVPDVNLEVGSGTHAAQTGQVLIRFEPIVAEYSPDWVVVPGDVNSTIACALAATKLGVKVAHLEAGLRSFDRTMPEEINRLLTDQIADLLLTPSRDGDENLLREGVQPEKIRCVGNVMIDTLVRLKPRADERWPELQKRFGLSERFVLVTLHRPGNVDDPAALGEVMAALSEVAGLAPVLFPVHPRTRQRLQSASLDAGPAVQLIEPLGYLDFLALESHADLVLTDSGGVQEETTYLGVPCLTARPNTERPVTISNGTNRLVATERGALIAAAGEELAAESSARPERPEFWDGRAAARIVDALRELG